MPYLDKFTIQDNSDGSITLSWPRKNIIGQFTTIATKVSNTFIAQNIRSKGLLKLLQEQAEKHEVDNDLKVSPQEEASLLFSFMIQDFGSFLASEFVPLLSCYQNNPRLTIQDDGYQAWFAEQVERFIDAFNIFRPNTQIDFLQLQPNIYGRHDFEF